jgi:hypothetical protein
MHDRHTVAGRGRRGPRRRIAAAAAAVGMLAALAGAGAGGASAATHDYCAWDGSYLFLGAYTSCFQSGENFLTDNYAYLPYAPSTPFIYCAAHLNGSLYGSYVGGQYACDHPYGGGNLLKATEYVDSAATTHGFITY